VDDRSEVVTKDEWDQVRAELDLPDERRQQLALERERAKTSQNRNLTDAEMARWRAHFEELLEQQKSFILEVVAEALGETSAEQRQEITKTVTVQVEAANNQKFADMLRLDLNALRYEVKKLRGGLVGEVSDLPNPLTDRRLN
jgi:hypothetical protein